MTGSLFVRDRYGCGNCLVCLVNGMLIITNSIAPFFSYRNSRHTDFKDICIFIIIIRIFTGLGFNTFVFIP